jgi:hypothetical protein
MGGARILCLGLAVSGALAGLALLSAWVALPQSAAPPLAGLPSAPGPHVSQIQALGDNVWLELPVPAADPTWGRCRGRSWGSRAAYSPELRAGFYYGEGNHGWYNDGNRRYMDDLWAYDVLANRWICLYPGAHVDNLSLRLDANGFEVDSTGQPIPVSQNVHGYEMLTYDTDRRKFMWVPCAAGYDAVLDPLRRSWGAYAGYAPSNCSPWMYNVVTGKFELLPSTGNNPSPGIGDVLMYLPSIRKVFLRTGSPTQANWDYVWFYDPDARTWTRVTPNGPSPFGILGGETVACYDSRRDRIYFALGSDFWTFDVRTTTWIPGSAPVSSGTNESFMNYDSVNDAVVVANTNSPPFGVYALDLASNSWTTVSTGVPAGMAFSKNSFYDPGLNVHYVHAATDNYEDGRMWVYRYRRSSGAGGATVTVSASDADASEPGGNTASLIITRSGGDTSVPLTVALSAGGTATPGSDYAPLGASVTIAAGSGSTSLAVTPVDDALVEPAETVVVTLSPGPGYTVATPGSATVTIADDDAPAATDSDGDGLPDAWETRYFSDLSGGAADDPDGDGSTNLQEYQGGSDPTSPASVPGGGGGGGGDGAGGCGATGLEIAVALACLARRSPWRRA